MEKKDPNQDFKCKQCDRWYSQRTSLARHVRVEHTERALFAWCCRCDFKSKRKDNLKRHYIQDHPECLKEVGGIPMETRTEKEMRTKRSAHLRVVVRKDLGDCSSWGEAYEVLTQERRKREHSRSRSPDQATDDPKEAKRIGVAESAQENARRREATQASESSSREKQSLQGSPMSLENLNVPRCYLGI